MGDGKMDRTNTPGIEPVSKGSKNITDYVR